MPHRRYFHSGYKIPRNDCEWIVLFPVSRVGRRTERSAENAREHSPLVARHSSRGKISHQGGAVRAHGTKQLRVAQSQVHGAVTAHGNAADATGLAIAANPVVTLNVRNEFVDEEIFVTHLSIA